MIIVLFFVFFQKKPFITYTRFIFIIIKYYTIVDHINFWTFNTITKAGFVYTKMNEWIKRSKKKKQNNNQNKNEMNEERKKSNKSTGFSHTFTFACTHVKVMILCVFNVHVCDFFFWIWILFILRYSLYYNFIVW